MTPNVIHKPADDAPSGRDAATSKPLPTMPTPVPLNITCSSSGLPAARRRAMLQAMPCTTSAAEATPATNRHGSHRSRRVVRPMPSVASATAMAPMRKLRRGGSGRSAHSSAPSR